MDKKFWLDYAKGGDIYALYTVRLQFVLTFHKQIQAFSL